MNVPGTVHVAHKCHCRKGYVRAGKRCRTRNQDTHLPVGHHVGDRRAPRRYYCARYAEDVGRIGKAEIVSEDIAGIVNTKIDLRRAKNHRNRRCCKTDGERRTRSTKGNRSTLGVGRCRAKRDDENKHRHQATSGLFRSHPLHHLRPAIPVLRRYSAA